MAIRPVLVDKRSPFVGEHCALCKEPFSPGEEIIICPVDAARHHVFCWSANGNRCAAFSCEGQGSPITRASTPALEDDEAERSSQPVSRVKTLPVSSFSCAQSCLVVAIAISIVIFAISCFGLWAIFDYIVVEILGWHYRQPLSEVITMFALATESISAMVTLIPGNP